MVVGILRHKLNLALGSWLWSGSIYLNMSHSPMVLPAERVVENFCHVVKQTIAAVAYVHSSMVAFCTFSDNARLT